MQKLLFFFLGIAIAFAQETNIESHQLSETEITTIFSSEVKNKYDIDFEVYRAYAYEDKAGSHIILMTENHITKGNDTFRKTHLKVYSDSIKTYFFDIKNEQLKLKRTLTDFIIQREFMPEYSISYWTKFFELDDFDGDGIIDPILIYGTYGMNGASDGRIKIIVLQNNKKMAIRHQNGILDGERHSTVDAAFYELSEGIQKQVIKQMEAIAENGSAIFPYDLKNQMKAKKLKLTE